MSAWIDIRSCIILKKKNWQPTTHLSHYGLFTGYELCKRQDYLHKFLRPEKKSHLPFSLYNNQILWKGILIVEKGSMFSQMWGALKNFIFIEKLKVIKINNIFLFYDPNKVCWRFLKLKFLKKLPAKSYKSKFRISKLSRFC